MCFRRGERIIRSAQRRKRLAQRHHESERGWSRSIACTTLDQHMDPSLARRLAAQAAKADGTAKVEGGMAAPEPCSSYTLDTRGEPFGICMCGFPKAMHALSPPSSRPPSSKPKTPEERNQGIALAQKRKKDKMNAIAAIDAALAEDTVDALTEALAQAKQAFVEVHKLEAATRRLAVLCCRAALHAAAAFTDPDEIVPVIDDSLRFENELHAERTSAMRHRQGLITRAALGRMHTALDTGALDAIDQAIEVVSTLHAASVAPISGRGFDLAAASMLRDECARARTKRADLAREAAAARLHEQLDAEPLHELDLHRFSSIISPLLEAIDNAKANGVDEAALQLAQARLVELQREDARARIAAAGDRLEALVKALETARKVGLPAEEVALAETRLHTAQHVRAKSVLRSSLIQAQICSPTSTDAEVTNAIDLLQSGIDEAMKVALPRDDGIEAAVARMLALKQQRARSKLIEALAKEDILLVSVAIHNASQALAFGQACPLRDEIEAAQAKLVQLEERSWARYLEGLLPAEQPDDPGTPEDLQKRKERLEAAVARLQSEQCPPSLLTDPRAALVTLEGRIAMVTRLVDDVVNATSLEQTEPLRQAISAARKGGVPDLFHPLRTGANLLERLENEEKMAFQRAEWEALLKRDLPLPNEFICPITHDKLVDPVVAADGHTYEREAILQWITRGTSPLTREAFEHSKLVPNHALKKRIEDYEAELFRRFRDIKQAVKAEAAKQRREQTLAALGTPAPLVPRRARTEPARRDAVAKHLHAASSSVPGTPPIPAEPASLTTPPTPVGFEEFAAEMEMRHAEQMAHQQAEFDAKLQLKQTADTSTTVMATRTRAWWTIGMSVGAVACAVLISLHISSQATIGELAGEVDMLNAQLLEVRTTAEAMSAELIQLKVA